MLFKTEQFLLMWLLIVDHRR